MPRRSHLYKPLVNQAGDMLPYARIRLYLEDGVTPYAGTIFRDRSSTRTYNNPFVASPGLVNLYFPAPLKLVIGYASDRSKPELLTGVVDVTFDAAESVSSITPLSVTGAIPAQALLCAIDANNAYWKPLRVDHEHSGVAPNTVVAGPISAPLRQAGDFPGATVLGAGAGGWGAVSSLRDSIMLGSLADGYGRGTVAIGHNATASESDVPPWTDGAIAVGHDAWAKAEGVAVGHMADARQTSGSGGSLLGRVVALGCESVAGPLGVAVGDNARASQGGIAIGNTTGSTSNGPADSIGLGAGAQYGLPSAVAPDHFAVMLGAYDPAAFRAFAWYNPNLSQSESWQNEYAPVMQFAGRTVQIQRHLQWLINSVALQVAGDATLGGPGGTLGFYGTTPKAQQAVGDDSPTSGIPALDSLILALRDLGLISWRTEALLTYRAEDLMRTVLNGDWVAALPEHFGRDVVTYTQPGVPPTFVSDSPTFNGLPGVVFDNGVYRRTSKSVQELRGANLLPEAKHYLVVGSHNGDLLGNNEGLVNLSHLDGRITADDTVLQASGYQTSLWDPAVADHYVRDGLDQSSNMDVGTHSGDPHVWRVTNRAVWPHARPVIGGPRDQGVTSGWDRWSGKIAEVVGLDNTWDEAHARSMERGLAFRYGIGQSRNDLQQPAQNFILGQHDPATGALIFFDQDYSDAYLGRIRGRATRVNKSVTYVPFLSIYIAVDFDWFRGSLVGNWGNLFGYLTVDVELVVQRKDTDFDLDDSVAIEEVGVFSLNNNFTWTMGRFEVREGHKRCHIRRKDNHSILCWSDDPPFRYADTEVRIYSTASNGSLFLEDTVPLWGDGTWTGKVRNAGHKVVRIYETSTGNLLGTTETQEKALPRTQVYATDDAEVSTANQDKADVYDAALTVLSFLEMGSAYWYRARYVIKTLGGVKNANGSLNDSYSSSQPAQATDTIQSRGMIWSIIAIMRYQEATGDAQFLPFARQLADYLITIQATSGSLNGSILTGPGATTANTSDNAVAYFAFRDLYTLTGVASYSTAAQAIKTSLLVNHWVPTTQRFGEGAGNDSEHLYADVLGGLFLLSIGDRNKARSTIRHLKRYRVKNATISAPHYSGVGSLVGYKLMAELGTTPYVAPPSVITQQGSWLAVLFKMRYGEPVGDDVDSLLRWQQTTISSDPTHVLSGQQFLSFSAQAVTGGYNLRPRPSLNVAAWGHLLSKGARRLLLPDPLPAPTPTGLVVSVTFDTAAYRFVFRYTWTADPTVPVAAYEAIPEQSTDGGTTWSALSASSVQAPSETARDFLVGPNGYSASWSVPVPNNVNTRYRVRVRLRNATVGTWVTSGSVTLPPIV